VFASRIGGGAGLGRLLAVAVLLAALAGLSLLAATGPGPLGDVVAPLTGHIVALGVVASVCLMWPRRALLLLTAGMLATLGLHSWLALARCCGAPAALAHPAQSGGQVAAAGLTVLALNTWSSRGDPDRLERYLASQPADVVVLSEFGRRQQPLLDRLAAVYPYRVGCGSVRPCSLALLSRLPLEAAGAARIAADRQQPAFVWARLAGSVTVIGTHLTRPSRDPLRHADEMRALAGFLRRIAGPLVVAGDLNTTPWSGSFRLLVQATGLSPASLLMPTWPAWPLALPQVALDHIFVSAELVVAAAGTGPAVGSDHLPVWARLEQPTAALHRPHAPARTLALGLAAAGAHLGGELLAHLGGEQVGARDLRR